MACSRGLWIELTHCPNAPALIEHAQAYLELAIPNADQIPMTIAMIGHRSKSKILHQIFHKNTIEHTRTGTIRLICDPLTRKQPFPLVVADCELHNASHESSLLRCGEAVHRTLVWADTEIDPLALQTVVWRLYARLLAPMAHVVCLFAADMRGLRGVGKQLATWAALPRASDLPCAALPKLIVVVETTSNTYDTKMAEQRLLTYITRQSCPVQTSDTGQRLGLDLARHFQELRVIALRKNSTDEPPQFNGFTHFRRQLLREASQVQQQRHRHQYAFKSAHYKAFFSLLCQHFSTSSTGSPFKFARASRTHNALPAQMSLHFRELLNLQSSEKSVNLTAVPLLSSAMVLDSSPPGTHRELSYFEFY